MDIKMLCALCGGTASTMLVRERKVVCFDCMAKKYPGHMVRLIHYLTTIKNVGTGDSSGTEGLSYSYKLDVKPHSGELVTNMPHQN